MAIKISFINNLVNQLGIPLAKFLTKNLVYTIKYGKVRIKRKGGLDFLIHRNPLEEQFLSGLDLKGKTVYDIGAYIGILTIFFGKSVSNSGRVIAFEPNLDNCLEIKKSIELNDLHNVDLLNIGIADTTGNAELAIRHNRTATGSMNSEIQTKILSEHHSKLLKVSIDTIDHCIVANRLSPPDLIKIDIEGMEYNALKGSDQTIKQYSPEMCIEIHGADKSLKIANIKNIIRLLHSYGYEVFHIESKKNITIENAEIAMEGHIFCKKKVEN
jgi:FkbM family methyltransferase